MDHNIILYFKQVILYLYNDISIIQKWSYQIRMDYIIMFIRICTLGENLLSIINK